MVVARALLARFHLWPRPAVALSIALGLLSLSCASVAPPAPCSVCAGTRVVPGIPSQAGARLVCTQRQAPSGPTRRVIDATVAPQCGTKEGGVLLVYAMVDGQLKKLSLDTVPAFEEGKSHPLTSGEYEPLSPGTLIRTYYGAPCRNGDFATGAEECEAR